VSGGRDRPVLLVLRALGLGDLLTVVPALRALVRAFPDHQRVLAAPAPLAPLVELLEPGPDGRPGFELVPAGPLEPLPDALYSPDLAVNLHGRGPQSHRVLGALAPRRLIAFGHRELSDHHGPEWRASEHEVARWCRLLGESGLSADPEELDLAPPALEAPGVAVQATLLHPGATSPARRWPARRWAAVARSELAHGRPVTITGTEPERNLALSVARRCGLDEGAVLAGRTDIALLASAVAAAARVVCGDTGVAHLATAMGTPSVVLFGPTPPSEWGPPPSRGRHRAVWTGARGDAHADTTDSGLMDISSARVCRELRELDHVPA
jgi:ADP-heptose:LPS heptosyltransferase